MSPIDAAKRQPTNHRRVLIYEREHAPKNGQNATTGRAGWHIGYFELGQQEWWRGDPPTEAWRQSSDVTHWRELPPVPGEREARIEDGDAPLGRDERGRPYTLSPEPYASEYRNADIAPLELDRRPLEER